MIVLCKIIVVLNIAGMQVPAEKKVKGSVNRVYDTVYMADFSSDVKQYDLYGHSSDYKSLIVDKTDCKRIK